MKNKSPKDYELKIIKGKIKIVPVGSLDPFTIPVTPYYSKLNENEK